MRVQTAEIDGIEYTARTLPAVLGLDVMFRLIRMLGQPAVNLIATLGQDQKNIDSVVKNKDLLMGFLSAMSLEVQAGDVQVFKLLCTGLQANRLMLGATTPFPDVNVRGDVFENFDRHFGGQYMHLGRVVFWLIALNFLSGSISEEA